MITDGEVMRGFNTYFPPLLFLGEDGELFPEALKLISSDLSQYYETRLHFRSRMSSFEQYYQGQEWYPNPVSSTVFRDLLRIEAALTTALLLHHISVRAGTVSRK